MSEFDKEAEREKLREQFAEEEKEREQTQRMSDLLLRGATMTNKHCEHCGSPIFRQNGEVFCPSCGGEATAVESAESAESPDGTANEGQTEEATDVDTPAPTVDTIPTEARPDPSVSTPESNTSGGEPAEQRSADTRTASPSGDRAEQSATGSQRTPHTGDLSEARAGLVRTLTTFVNEAEATDDAGRARELLATAREAAETLEAVERLD